MTEQNMAGLLKPNLDSRTSPLCFRMYPVFSTGIQPTAKCEHARTGVGSSSVIKIKMNILRVCALSPNNVYGVLTTSLTWHKRPTAIKHPEVIISHIKVMVSPY